MEKYWVAHMKDGQNFCFDRQSGYVCTLDNTNLVVFMTERFGDCLAIIPPENILWIERIEKE